MLRILLCAFMLAVSLPVLAQSSNERDSLAYRLQRLESTNRFNPKDTTHIKLLVELAFSYRYLEMDSLYSIGKRALEYSEKIDYT